MAFRIQDLMMDVRPGGWQMANPECTCQITAKTGAEREPGPGEDPGPGDHPGRGRGIPDGNPALPDTVPPSADCPPARVGALAADLAMLRAQLRRDLGQSA
jgi:hypothetical protein